MLVCIALPHNCWRLLSIIYSRKITDDIKKNKEEGKSEEETTMRMEIEEQNSKTNDDEEPTQRAAEGKA